MEGREEKVHLKESIMESEFSGDEKSTPRGHRIYVAQPYISNM